MAACLESYRDCWALVVCGERGEVAAPDGDIFLSGVIEPGAGTISTCGPVHLERRATTSASRLRSAKSTLGCNLSSRHAVSQEMVSDVAAKSLMRIEVSWAGGAESAAGPQPTLPHAIGFPQQPLTVLVLAVSCDGSGQ